MDGLVASFGDVDDARSPALESKRETAISLSVNVPERGEMGAEVLEGSYWNQGYDYRRPRSSL